MEVEEEDEDYDGEVDDPEVAAYRAAASFSPPLPQRQRPANPNWVSSSQGRRAYDKVSRVSTTPSAESAPARPPGRGLSTPAAQRTASAPPAADAATPVAGYHAHSPQRQREPVPQQHPQSPTKWVDIFTEFLSRFCTTVLGLNEFTVTSLIMPVIRFIVSQPQFIAFAHNYEISKK